MIPLYLYGILRPEGRPGAADPDGPVLSCLGVDRASRDCDRLLRGPAGSPAGRNRDGELVTQAGTSMKRAVWYFAAMTPGRGPARTARRGPGIAGIRADRQIRVVSGRNGMARHTPLNDRINAKVRIEHREIAAIASNQFADQFFNPLR